MVCEWGMSDQLGMVEYGEGDSPVFLARDMAKSRNYSEDTARMIDAEIKRFIDEAYQEAERILHANKDKVELIANALLEYETLDASHLRDLIEFGEMKDPPSAPKPPPVPDDPPTAHSPPPSFVSLARCRISTPLSKIVLAPPINSQARISPVEARVESAAASGLGNSFTAGRPPNSATRSRLAAAKMCRCHPEA